MHADQSMIEFTGTGKKYGRRRAVDALRDASFTIPQGAVCAVVGPNGAGKSTLLGLLLGFLQPSSGTVRIASEPPREYVRDHGVGYVPDRFSLPYGWPVSRAVRALCAMHAVSGPSVGALIDSYGLRAHADKAVGTLSRGLQQRVGLAQAFGPDHDLLVLDEPAEGLDPVWRVRLRDMIADRRARGKTTVLASHDMTEVERVADLVIVLERGTVRETIASAAVTDTTFRLQLEEPLEHITALFPEAVSAGDGSYIIQAAGTEDLNRRIAALIEMGGRMTSLQRGGAPLEDRLRRSVES